MIMQLSSRPDHARLNQHQGFTLVELAVALFVVGLLLAGALIPLSTQMEVRSIAETRRIMDQINEALIGFAQANGRLPCPANATTQTGISTAGTEQYVANVCTSAVGVIPWSTLGVPETDAWGRRFTYRVAAAFADAISLPTFETNATVTPIPPATQSPTCTPSSTPTQSSFALCTLGEIALLNRSTDAALSKPTPGVLGSGLAAAFVSHGRNGFGGYIPVGTQISGLTAATDEAYNVAGGLSSAVTGSHNSFAFFSRTPTPNPGTTACSDTNAGFVFCEYDDIVYMISQPTLIARMVSAGRLP